MNFFLKITFISFLVFNIFWSCNKEPLVENIDLECTECEDPIYMEQCDILTDYLNGTTLFSENMPTPSPLQEGEESAEEDGDYDCRFFEVTWAPEFNEHFILQPFTEVIFPGNLIDGNTILDGSYRPIVTPRDTATLSISVLTNSGTSSKIEVGDPSKLSNVRDGINELLMQVAPESTPAFINYEIEKVRSEQEAGLSLNAHFKGWGAKVTASYNWNKKEVKSRYLIKFQQVYYSIDMDLPAYACQLFNPVPDEEKAAELFENTSPVYVSSVKYGRMVYFMVESSFDEESVEKALDASFKKFGVGGGVNISQSDRNVLENSSISALIIGGSADGAVQTITDDPIEGLKNFIEADADFSVNAQGVPLAYTLRFLKDNSVANVVLTSNYIVRQCELKGKDYTFHPSNGEEYYFCASPEIGTCDKEFAGHGPKVYGGIKLEPRNGNEIWAVLDFKWDETGYSMCSGEYRPNTEGYVRETIHIHTITDGTFLSFTTDPDVYVNYTDVDHDFDYPNFSGGDFMSQMIFMGDTSGKDLGCASITDDANVRFYFKPITIKIKEQ